MWASVARQIARGALAGGIGTAMVAGVAWGQATAAPRYQSPFGAQPASTPTLPTPAAITPNGTVVEDVVVRVNDQIINRSDVERSAQQMQQELQQQQSSLSPSEREQREKDMLRDMIDQQLLLSKGKELGLNADAEVIRRLDEIRKQNHLDAIEDKDCPTAGCTSLEKAARQQGVSFEDFRANIKNNVITQQVVRDEVGRRLQMTQAQEQTYYDAHKQDFAEPEQVRLSEILVPLAADADPAALEQAHKKADEIAAKVKAGGKFDELAKQYSGGPTAAQGGDLGDFKRGALAKVLEDQTFGLKAGETTAPIRTKQGFVILQVTEHRQEGVPPLKNVEQQVQEAIYMQQMQPALRSYLTKLREEAYIDIKPGFVDTGASAKETKPVFSAYAAPTPKKKKIQQKARFDRSRGVSAGAGTVASTGPATRTTPAGVPALPPESAGTGATATGSAAPAATTTPTTTTTASADIPPGPVAPVTSGKTRASAKTVAGEPKRKKIKREKIRYGQAPRNSLPAGTLDTATGSDVGEGATSAAVTPGGVMAEGAAANTAPGAAIAPVGTGPEVSSTTTDADPLGPKSASSGKTRFAAKDKEFRAQKAATKQAKVQEKIAATPAGPDTQETATRKTQAAPLGLNGDTATKKKKVKVKGAPKERLQEKKPDETPATPIAPTVNPTALGADTGSAAPAAPTADRTTLPPATAPAPGAPPQGQPLSPTGTPPTTPNGTPAPPQ